MKKSLLLLPVLILTACASTSLQPTANAVRVVVHEPTNCPHVGEITGSQGGWWDGSLRSNASLETGALNDLKNKAAALGGNTVVILSHDSNHYLTGQKNTVTLTGSVYHCEEGS